MPFWFLALATATLGVVTLVLGRGFLVPLAVALLIFVLFTAGVDALSRLRVGGRRLPRWAAMVLATIITFAAAGLVGWLVVDQVRAIAAATPAYLDEFEDAVRALAARFGAAGSADRIVAGIEAGVDSLGKSEFVSAATGVAAGILAAMAFIFLYVVFLLIDRPLFPAKLRAMFDRPEDGARALRVARSVGRNVQRYILIKVIAGFLTAVLAWAVMRAVGLDFAETFALFTFLLDFIPNIGSVVAAALPVLVAILQFDSLGPLLLVGFGLAIVHLGVGYLVEPLLYGRSLNLSPLVVIVSLVFWASVWGLVGMFLAVPIMTSIMILCAHVPRLQRIALLLSADGSLDTMLADTAADDAADFGARQG